MIHCVERTGRRAASSAAKMKPLEVNFLIKAPHPPPSIQIHAVLFVCVSVCVFMCVHVPVCPRACGFTRVCRVTRVNYCGFMCSRGSC